jgi:hypothetical protein
MQDPAVLPATSAGGSRSTTSGAALNLSAARSPATRPPAPRRSRSPRTCWSRLAHTRRSPRRRDVRRAGSIRPIAGRTARFLEHRRLHHAHVRHDHDRHRRLRRRPFPTRPAASMDRGFPTPGCDDGHLGASWCPSARLRPGTDVRCGTPGATNDRCSRAVGFCRRNSPPLINATSDRWPDASARIRRRS